MTSFVSPVYISRTISVLSIFKNLSYNYNNFGTELIYVYKNKSTIYKVNLMFVSVS